MSERLSCWCDNLKRLWLRNSACIIWHTPHNSHKSFYHTKFTPKTAKIQTQVLLRSTWVVVCPNVSTLWPPTFSEWVARFVTFLHLVSSWKHNCGILLWIRDALIDRLEIGFGLEVHFICENHYVKLEETAMCASVDFILCVNYSVVETETRFGASDRQSRSLFLMREILAENPKYWIEVLFEVSVGSELKSQTFPDLVIRP